MKKLLRLRLMLSLSLISLGAGCSDERLVRHAEQSVATQQQQNIWQARQSEIVAKQSEALAVATRELVAHDAQARSELLTAEREVRQEAAKLDDERRDLTDARSRESLVVATLQTVGGIALCLVPLVIVGYVLRELQRPDSGAELVNEYLLMEVIEQPQLKLTAKERPLLRLAPFFCRRISCLKMNWNVNWRAPRVKIVERFGVVAFSWWFHWRSSILNPTTWNPKSTIGMKGVRGHSQKSPRARLPFVSQGGLILIQISALF